MASLTAPTKTTTHIGQTTLTCNAGVWGAAVTNCTPIPTLTVSPGAGTVYQGFDYNGGNIVAYSNIELWTMGLIPDAELQSVDVAQGAVPSTTEPGVFTATGLVTYTPDQIIARVLPQARPSTATPRAWRGLVVLATTDATVSAATRDMLNGQIDRFSQRVTPVAGAMHNFWSATGRRATIQLSAASALGN